MTLASSAVAMSAWVLVAMFAASSAVTLTLLTLRAFGRIPRDSTVDRWISWLIKGLLIEGAAAVILVGAQWMKQPAAVPAAFPMTVRVPANKSAVAAFTPGADSQESRGYLDLKPGERLRLSAASTTRWSTDPLDGIRFMLENVSAKIDVSEEVRFLTQLDSDPRRFREEYLMIRWQLLVDKNLASNNYNLPAADTVESVLQFWNNEYLCRQLSSVSPDSEGRYWLDIAPTSNPLLSTANRMVWPRVLAARWMMSNVDFSSLIPNDSIDGSPQLAGSAGRGFPLPGAPAGCLTYVRVGEPKVFRLSVGDDIYNDSDQTWKLSFGINDDIPEDNGDGFAQLQLERSDGPSR